MEATCLSYADSADFCALTSVSACTGHAPMGAMGDRIRMGVGGPSARRSLKSSHLHAHAEVTIAGLDRTSLCSSHAQLANTGVHSMSPPPTTSQYPAQAPSSTRQNGFAPTG